MDIKNIELNKKNIAIAVALAIAFAISYNTLRPLTPDEMQEKIKAEITRLNTERSSQISALNKCIDKLKKNMNTLDASYISDCKINSPVITEANASDKTESSTSTGTSTGGIAPVPERNYGTEGNEGKIVRLKPSELLGPVKISDDCYVTQTESDHVRPERGGMFATDLACKFGAVGGVGGKAEVYAPDLRGKSVGYKVIYVGQDQLLGSFIQLAYMNNVEGAIWDESFYLGHTETKLKVGDEVYTGQRIGQMILNGATTGWHVHFEYRRLTPSGTWASQRYFTGLKEAQLDKKRKGVTFNGWKWGDTIYATTYDLGDVNQNDASPFIGASGKDMRHIEGAVALTKDVRRSLGISFGDKIQIKSDRDGLYYTVQVEDEMNSRYRESGPNDCIKPNSGSSRCIKMDMARPSNMLSSGEYALIKKL